MSALHEVSALFTPMRLTGHGNTAIVLRGNAGGFDLRGCPAGPQLAVFIQRACNHHADLVDALQITLDLIQQLEGMDNRAEPTTDVSQLHRLLAKVQA
jgi:hypothetical protein